MENLMTNRIIPSSDRTVAQRPHGLAVAAGFAALMVAPWAIETAFSAIPALETAALAIVALAPVALVAAAAKL